MRELTSQDFELGELVLFKNRDTQPDPSANYRGFYGHLCVVTAKIPFKHVQDCLTVRSIATGEQVSCWVSRVEKYEEQTDGGA